MNTIVNPNGATAPSRLELQVTFFYDLQAKKLKVATDTWENLCKLLRAPPEYPHKKRCKLIKLATFGDKRTDKDSLRHNENMLQISGIEGDYDGELVPIQQAADMLQAAGIEAILYSSPSHTPAAPRWRVLCPLSRPYAASERRRFVEALNKALGGILASESYTQSQAFFLGRVQGAPYETAASPGQPIDLVASTSDPGEGRPVTAHTPSTNVLPGFGPIPEHVISSNDPLTQSLLQGPPSSMAIILSKSFNGTGCNQLKDICSPDSQKNQDYNRWCAGLSIAASCIDGLQMIHEVSRHGKNYTFDETIRKAGEFRGKPFGCATFHSKWPDHCKDCKHFEEQELGKPDGKPFKLPSPILLGTGNDAGSNAASDEDAALIARLAALPKLEYDRVRAKEAKTLNVRTSTLDELVEAARGEKAEADDAPFTVVEPWPEPVDPADLLQQITALVQRFVVCEQQTAIAAALWIALSWFADYVEVLPLANITAPQKRCGKSTLLFLMSRLVRKPLAASNISPAALFRSIDKWSPTILLDEADAFLKDNEELRGLINSGHTRGSAYVIRVVGEDFRPERFNTWGPKVLCGIGKLADTLEDRSISLELRRRLPNEKIDKLRQSTCAAQFNSLTRQLARLAQDYGEQVRDARPSMPDDLNDRACDNWESMLAIADIAGGGWPELARAAALQISGGTESVASIEIELLQDIQEVFAAQKATRLFSSQLLSALRADEDRPWASYNRGAPISPRQLAGKLKLFGIESHNVWIEGVRAKGYELQQFEDAFGRYLGQVPESSEPAI